MKQHQRDHQHLQHQTRSQRKCRAHSVRAYSSMIHSLAAYYTKQASMSSIHRAPLV
uniref:Rpd3 n=1 Tax=Arundo donax TaxID=35708 RepID=A0A0A9E6Q4_ARUDO